MYVAMTRAKKRLYLTSARSRFMYGSTQNNPRSRFLKEAEEKIRPQKLTSDFGGGYRSAGYVEKPKRTLSEIMRSVNGATADLASASKSSVDFKLGDKVVHPRYGVGRIIQVSGDNASVAFDGLGIKQFNMKIAPFKKA